MKIRVYRRGGIYLPQYSSDGTTWNFFIKNEESKNKDIYRCILKFYNEKNRQSFTFDNLFLKGINENEVLGFVDMLTAYAFIGAATYFYSEEHIEVNLNLDK